MASSLAPAVGCDIGAESTGVKMSSESLLQLEATGRSWGWNDMELRVSMKPMGKWACSASGLHYASS
eukprot:scaffold8647_cov40-Prasinocladus_malaysianus.AAC.3